VLGLQAKAGAGGQGGHDGLLTMGEPPPADDGRRKSSDHIFFGSSEPMWPLTSIVAQVPAGTAFQALP
jgi:hypothetical protein